LWWKNIHFGGQIAKGEIVDDSNHKAVSRQRREPQRTVVTAGVHPFRPVDTRESIQILAEDGFEDQLAIWQRCRRVLRAPGCGGETEQEQDKTEQGQMAAVIEAAVCGMTQSRKHDRPPIGLVVRSAACQLRQVMSGSMAAV